MSFPHLHLEGRALVVGASGQLGTALCGLLGAAALPAARKKKDGWLPLDLERLEADGSSLAEMLERYNVTSVLCAAGATDVERCESDPVWAAAANHTGPLALAHAARHLPFVFFSTDYVFDGASGPYSEDARPNPLSVYGRSKLAGEEAILQTHPRALVLRTTTVYGPDPQGKNFLYTLRRLLAAGQSMRVPADQYANPTYNADLATAALELVGGGHRGVFHVAGPEFLSRIDFAEQACRVLGLDASLLQPLSTAELGQRAARPLRGGLRSDRLTATLGHNPMRRPAEGIVDWIAAESAASPTPRTL